MSRTQDYSKQAAVEPKKTQQKCFFKNSQCFEQLTNTILSLTSVLYRIQLSIRNYFFFLLATRNKFSNSILRRTMQQLFVSQKISLIKNNYI